MFVEVSAARPYDPAVIALCAEQRAELAGASAGHRDAAVDSLGLRPDVSFLVARADTEPVGCAGLQFLEPGVGEIKRMYVRPAHRGQGISRLLLDAIERLARDRGALTVRLETGDLQPEALGFYQFSGYVRIPHYRPYVGSALSLCFEKRL
ncbi:GNAT family N-acetyltransferase [Actinomadura sp. HBU206391]|nr:GNAT family N-acetyltransferase [Actinomadura sp. HBU206391]